MRTINFRSIALSIVFAMIITINGHSQNADKNIKNAFADDSCHLVQNVYYTCAAHPKVKVEKAGNCPQCGMTMDRKKEAIYYSCPTHSEVQHSKKGNCERCGTALEENHKHMDK